MERGKGGGKANVNQKVGSGGGAGPSPKAGGGMKKKRPNSPKVTPQTSGGAAKQHRQEGGGVIDTGSLPLSTDNGVSLPPSSNSTGKKQGFVERSIV